MEQERQEAALEEIDALAYVLRGWVGVGPDVIWRDL